VEVKQVNLVVQAVELLVMVALAVVMETHPLQLLLKAQPADVHHIQMLRQLVAVEQSMQVVLVDQDVLLVVMVVMEQQQVLQDLQLQELVAVVEEMEELQDLQLVEEVDQVVEEMVGEFHLIHLQELQTLAVAVEEELTLLLVQEQLLETVAQV
jgi:hypothetical protein